MTHLRYRTDNFRLVGSFVFALVGVAIHYGTLVFVDRQVENYPTVPDILMDQLPRIDFGDWGEAYYFALIAVYVLAYFGWQRQTTSQALVSVGLLYISRSLFLLFLPIGPPHGSIPADERLNLWGFADHAFFPGGHVAILLLLAFQLKRRTLRWMMVAGSLVFGLGTILAKTHYTADVIGGALLAFAVYAGIRLWQINSSSQPGSD